MAHERRSPLNELTRTIAAALRDDPGAIGALAAVDDEVVYRAADHHAVLPLLYEQLATRRDLPGRLRAGLEERASRHAAFDLAREAELRSALRALTAAGVRPVIFKGAHLAYTHYRRPDLRPRLDTDILVPMDARASAGRALLALGYEQKSSSAGAGALATSQATFVKRQDGLTTHAIDLHWRLLNPESFASVLTHADLTGSAAAVPSLGPDGMAPSDVQALLIACIHRIAHHHDGDCLIWLYDIHLLASRFTAAEWHAFVTLASERSVTLACRRSLEAASAAFGTVVPAAWPSTRSHEPGAAYLRPDRRRTRHLVADLRALSSWSNRVRLVREHLMPPPIYMRDVYAPGSRAPLPVLYAWRVVRGARKWLIRL